MRQQVAQLTNVPTRTTMALVTRGGVVATKNAAEPRPGLSIVKLFIADYALRHGDGHPIDRRLAEVMVRFSDDGAAHHLMSKYPKAITKIAREYGMGETQQGRSWGTTMTTSVDTAMFLHKLRTRNTNSMVLKWMRTSTATASDGTRQNWGTKGLPGVTGTKWGWSDYGRTASASASIGDGFSVVAFSWGGLGVQNVDVRPAARYLG
ncbi:MAG TPA: serine hydrolase [Candidatus Corynebacterium gallistercoris]|uniref:Serine hydrolase n=1 Tax=Candidatus Corynebacterium gallistercoris TaxID=2838530 RepID=A0A9D1RWI5_9CORY|nr:serine hydrolase [Candidatus Corynebacterium gallistercoris]